MNKTQINFFCERAKIVERRVKKNHQRKYLPLDQLSIEQIISKIASEEARFKYEIFEGDNCPRIGFGAWETLTTLFDIPAISEINEKNSRREKIMKRVENRIDDYRERLEESFVMKEIADPRVSLEEFEKRNFFKPKEEEILMAISDLNMEMK